MSAEREPRHSLVARVVAHAAERDATIDRATAKRRGVVHTPAEIAQFVARAAHEAVQRELGRAGGLASDDVVLVDPATGPGVFLAAAIEVAQGASAPRACVGLDVDAAALARAEEVLAPAARDRGWPLRLACSDALASLAPVPELADDDVVRVVIGNPPWAARTANRDAALTEALLEDFRRDEGGVRLAERRIGVLSDDYVRFVRWGAELVGRARRGGVLAMVTNASFLDGPVHRAMRAALARWMDRIDVVDLGGSSLIARSGGADENTFGVRPSVAITIAVRRGVRANGAAIDLARGPREHGAAIDLEGGPRADGAGIDAERGARADGAAVDGERTRQADGGARNGADDGGARNGADRGAEPSPRRATLRIATLRGSKQEKLAALVGGALRLEEHAIDRPWTTEVARAPDAYARWPSLAEWMPFHREGLQTNRDELVIDGDRDALLAKLDALARGAAARETDHWDLDRARRIARSLLGDEGALAASLRRVAYRPFDERWAVTHPALCHRPRPALARAIARSPFALITARKDRGQLAWMHFGASRAMPDNCWLSTRSSCRARAFPLARPDGAPNLDATLRDAFSSRVGESLDVEMFAAWALAWMASHTYREACDGALRADYPRIPAPRDRAELALFAAHGRAIASAFLDDDRADTAIDGDAAPLRIGHHRPRSSQRVARLAATLREADAALRDRVVDRLRAGA